jgi:hypothetical protein
MEILKVLKKIENFSLSIDDTGLFCENGQSLEHLKQLDKYI